jgi:hypothetical protein
MKCKRPRPKNISTRFIKLIDYNLLIKSSNQRTVIAT